MIWRNFCEELSWFFVKMLISRKFFTKRRKKYKFAIFLYFNCLFPRKNDWITISKVDFTEKQNSKHLYNRLLAFEFQFKEQCSNCDLITYSICTEANIKSIFQLGSLSAKLAIFWGQILGDFWAFLEPFSQIFRTPFFAKNLSRGRLSFSRKMRKIVQHYSWPFKAKMDLRGGKVFEKLYTNSWNAFWLYRHRVKISLFQFCCFISEHPVVSQHLIM